MAHFTQLGLSGEPERKPDNTNSRTNSSATARPGVQNARFAAKASGNKQSSGNGFSSGQKAAAVVVFVIAASLLGISLLESGCSKGSDKSAVIAPPAQPATSSILPSPVSTPPTITVATSAKRLAHKSPVQRKLIASTYGNPLYGVSFRYPKSYSLKEGDKANSEWSALQPVEMNFLQPGGTTLTTVELPDELYRGTDFAAGFFTVSVNTNLSAANCEQFAAPDADPKTGAAPDQTAPVAPTNEKLGAGGSTEVHFSDQAKQADAKYYHVFQNGACYEFVLGVETASDKAADGMKALNRDQVFRRLNWMLSTVKIQPAGVPAEAAKTTGAAAPGGKE